MLHSFWKACFHGKEDSKLVFAPARNSDLRQCGKVWRGTDKNTCCGVDEAPCRGKEVK